MGVRFGVKTHGKAFGKSIKLRFYTVISTDLKEIRRGGGNHTKRDVKCEFGGEEKQISMNNV